MLLWTQLSTCPCGIWTSIGNISKVALLGFKIGGFLIFFLFFLIFVFSRHFLCRFEACPGTSYCRPGWPKSQISVSDSQVQGLRACTTNRQFSNFLRNNHTGIQSSWLSLQPHQQWRSVLLTRYPCQLMLSSVFLILAIATDVTEDHRVVLIFISLMDKEFGNFPKCLSVILDSYV